MKETTKNTLKDAAVFAIAIAAAFTWAHLGANLHSWLSIPFITAVTYFSGIIVSRTKTNKWEWEAGILWGAIGLVAGLAFYFGS